MARTVLVVLITIAWVGGFMAWRYEAPTVALRAVLAAIAFAPLPLAIAILHKTRGRHEPGDTADTAL